MKASYACNSPEHRWSRRDFLAGTGAGAFSLLGFGSSLSLADAGEIRKQDKRVIVIDLVGGVSQLESWDPKPGAATGGPFRAIPTSVTGIHISELLPYTAQQMHRMAIVRSLDTKENNHGKGRYIMQTGRRQSPAETYPHLGSVVAKLLSSVENPLPGYIHITPRGSSGFNRGDAAFLGPKYASVTLGDGKPPANLLRPSNLSEQADTQRDSFRTRLNNRFTNRRRTADTAAYTYTYEQAAQVMQRKHIFDISREAPSLQERYGKHDFGRHCLMARRLVENGVTFVKVSHRNYDTHHENFNFHLEQLGEFDRSFATLLEDLAQRGLLERTLVVVLSEFGRTPRINQRMGRDHWGRSWSVALAGCGIKAGTVVGKTSKDGTKVSDRMVDGGHMFHTYLEALGLNSTRNHYVDGRPIPMADPKAAPIKEILA